MKRNLFFTVVLFAFISTLSDAQTITGKVVDTHNEPVEFATVVLLTSDSLFVNAGISDSIGVFTFRNEMPAYRILVQHLMYEAFEKSYSGEYELTVELVENVNLLNEIVVKGERPVVRMIEGRMTYDMQLLLSGKAAGNAYESMLLLPGVREQDGALALAGALGVTVIINGRATSMPVENLMAALKTIPVDRIQNAEIMYSAPPQYHVRGAVINLILKDGASNDRLQGQTTSSYTQKHYANAATGVSFLLPASKLTADFNYTYNRRQSRSVIDQYSNHLYEGVVLNIEQFNRGNRKSDNHHFRLGMGYKWAETEQLNLSLMSQITGKVDNNEWSDGTFSHSFNHKENKSPNRLHNVLLDYTSGFGLKTGIDYTTYYDNNYQHFIEQESGRENEFAADAKQCVNRIRFFADQ
ncbi:MAG: carboxypeptidase-like regulatory domain-containing protein, partial [Tannerella sp.]|nr:carboxypeptidase-like regulatory domain-containing protein [Tannerella sp.]